ncbi:uncharacterized protein V1510DRAFT_409937 [Dipodascopsis tothii]|uniref:uncharacterized protein n=1 Tax=Dipodascopsis tothii TaxID=44089 RepID=UPI0034CE1EFC
MPEVGATRYIGDLDPASVLLTLRKLEKNNIGVWVKGVSVNQPVNQHLVAYLNSLHAFDLPPRQDREGLLAIYFKYINPILPLLDQDKFLHQHARDECPTLLLHAVLLAACRHNEARRFLHLRSPRHFASLTATKIRALIYANFERDKLTVVRVLALLSLHSEGSDGLEKSCSDLEQSFHYAHFLGLHHERQSHPDQTPMRALWWSLWCLDRMSACISARPLISRLDDVGVSRLEPHEKTWLAQLFEVCSILDKVIAMYRPEDMPVPPPIAMGLDERMLPPEHAAAVAAAAAHAARAKSAGRKPPPVATQPFVDLLRLVRCAAVILAHKRVPDEQDSSDILLEAASQITTIVSSQHSLPPLPVVPYAVSLTLTVYLRLYPAPDAIAGWSRSCAVLDDLSRTWWVAEAMGSMARSIFKKLEEDTFASEQTTPLASAPPPLSQIPVVPLPVVPVVPLHPPMAPPSLPSPSPMPSPGPATNQVEPTQILDMFSDLPNPTSFLEQALMLDDFAEQFYAPGLQFEAETAPAVPDLPPAIPGFQPSGSEESKIYGFAL